MEWHSCPSAMCLTTGYKTRFKTLNVAKWHCDGLLAFCALGYVHHGDLRQRQMISDLGPMESLASWYTTMAKGLSYDFRMITIGPQGFEVPSGQNRWSGLFEHLVIILNQINLAWSVYICGWKGLTELSFFLYRAGSFLDIWYAGIWPIWSFVGLLRTTCYVSNVKRSS